MVGINTENITQRVLGINNVAKEAGNINPVGKILGEMFDNAHELTVGNVGELSPIHKVIYEIASGKFIGTPTRTIMSQAVRIHFVYHRRCNA